MPRENTGYKYTRLGSLPESGKVNIYGVVENVVISNNGSSSVRIEDEEASVTLRIAKDSRDFFKDLCIKDIIRIHRVQVGLYQNERILVVEIAKCGCHAVIWRGDSNVPVMATSGTYTITDEDSVMLSSLRGWLRSKETCVHPLSFCSTGNSCGEISSDKKMLKLPSCPTITSAADILDLDSRFFNWYAQVLGVYKARGEKFTVFLRTWDGTKPRFAPCRNMFRADSDSIEIVYCEISKDLCHLIESYIIDVCCYGNWAEKATKLKIGDIVFLGNIRNYVCRSNRISAITLHEGGLRFNRALNVADRNDPKCFEISKRCADMLSLYPELGSGLLEGSSEEIVTPIINDEVHAQSSPKIILSKYQASKSMGNEFAESVGTRLRATSEACDGNIMLTDFSTEDSVIENTGAPSCVNEEAAQTSQGDETTHSDVVQVSAANEVTVGDECSQWLDARQGTSSRANVCCAETQTVNNKVESFSTEEEVMDCQHHEEDSADNLSDRETQDFLVELERDDRPDSNELSEIADFCDKIRHDLIEEFFERELAKLCEFDRNDKDLREEVEGILRMNVGERVSIVNYVEAELSFLAQESYLKNALLFTATCVKCGIEVIVERCSKNWCQICFEKHECLSIVQYSYRLVVPSIYAFDGAVGQLCLALDGNIWAALSSSDQLSVINVMQLYSEYDLTKFTEKLDNLLRSVEAIMKKKKFSVKDGKLMALDRIKGSVLVFVDRCLVADRNC